MSDGLHNMAGADGEIFLNGVSYRTIKLRLKHKAELEAHILANRPDLIGEVAASVQKLPEDLRDAFGREFISAAIRQVEQRKSVSREEYNAYCDTFDGVCYVMWQMLRDHNPELADSYDLVKPLCEGIEIEILQHKIDQASGDSSLKNSAGLTATTKSRQAKNEHLGQNCIASSPLNSAGRQPSSTS